MHIHNSDSRGAASEAAVEQALNILKENKEKPKYCSSIPKIADFVHAPRHSRLDRKKIDFLIILADGKEVPIQVKSSERGRRKFERRNKFLGISVSVVVVHAGEELSSLIRKIINCIKIAFNKVKRTVNQKVHRRRLRRWYENRHAPCMCH